MAKARPTSSAASDLASGGNLKDWLHLAEVNAAETPPPLHKPDAATRVAVDWDAADVCAGVVDGAVDAADDSDEKNEANDENDSDEDDAADDDDDGANDIEGSAQLLHTQTNNAATGPPNTRTTTPSRQASPHRRAPIRPPFKEGVRG